MKKFILLVLVLTLVCTSSLCAYAQNAFPEEHTLWGIPFGTSEEDFLKIATEKSGFVFTLDDKSNFKYINAASFISGNKTIKEDTIYYVDTSKQNISFLGYPLEGVYAVFHAPDADSSGFKMFRFEFESPGSGYMKKEKMMEALFNSIGKSFGSITNGWIRVGSDEDTIVYDPPVQNSILDTETITKVWKDYSSPAIFLCWDNVRLATVGSRQYLDFYGYYVDYSQAESSVGYYGVNDPPEVQKDVNVGL